MILRCPNPTCRRFVAEITTAGISAIRLHCQCGADLALVLDHNKTSLFTLPKESKKPCTKQAR
jgi:hypothetical protein